MTDEQRPWRAWPEYVRCFPPAPGDDSPRDDGWRLDTLCARVWREAQVDAAKQDSPAPRMSLESHLKHVESRADAAEAQRDRLAAALRTAQTYFHNGAILMNRWSARSVRDVIDTALADVPGHEGGHSVPAAESAADTDTLPDSTNATITQGEGESHADSYEAYRAMVEALESAEAKGFIWGRAAAALALARQAEE